MPNGRNRLERLFSKRKTSAPTTSDIPRPIEIEQHKTAAVAVAASAATDDTLFPPPSFLRPKGARMIARDEPNSSNQGVERAQSLPEAQSERVSIHSPNPSTASTGDIGGPLTRSTSMVHRRKDLHHMASLHDFRFPLPPTLRSPGMSPSSSSASCSSPRAIASYRGRHLEHRHSSALPQTRLQTPPSSDHEDNSFLRGIPKTPFLPHGGIATTGLPTPAASPEMKPAINSPTDSDLLLARKRSRFAPLRRRKEEKAAGLRRAQSHANLVIPPDVLLPKPVLKGVDVTDFFDLSDEDLAEEVEESSEPTTPNEGSDMGASAECPSTPASSKRSSGTPVTTDPLADTMAHGAVQVARIAAKHNFDLVYIVNLWPEKSDLEPQGSNSTPGCSRRNSTASSLLGSTDGTVIETASGMTGRLLAAYGLSKVASPFRISAAVHAKILRHESWIEYRSSEATQEEFSRGYGHAFHTSKARAPRSVCPGDGDDSVSIRQSENDRGIVFAAYRQPGSDGKTRGSSPAELQELRADAEDLIDMLIAIHKAKRRQDPAAHLSVACDVGPMPAQFAGMSS